MKTEETTPTTYCGCHLDPVQDDETEPCDLCSEATGMFDGTGWKITMCPMHKAAPDLLEALERLVGDHQCECGECAYCQGTAAIAKAQGRTPFPPDTTPKPPYRTSDAGD